MRLNLPVCTGIASSLFLGLALSPTVMAEGSAKLSNVFLEEVVVTARMREESLQDAPISISAFTGDSLEYRGVSNIGDIASLTSNLTFQNNPSFGGSSNAASVYIRGVGQKEFLPTTDPGVGIYVDGVYIARSVGAILDLVDVERVEVLRGPQGTLFGRNTIGGAISLTTKKPHSELAGKVSVTTGTDSRADLKASLNLPLSDNLYAMASVASFNRDGYVTREDGIDLGDDDTSTGRIALRWEASDSLLVDFSADYTRDRENGPAFTLTGINLGNPVDPNTPPMAVINNVGANVAAGNAAIPCATPDSRTNIAVPGCYDYRYVQGSGYNAGTAAAFSESDMWSAGLNIAWDISDHLILKSFTSVRDLDSEFARDGDHSPMTVSQFYDDYQQEQFSQEFQLLGSGENYDWILGAYYFDEKGQNENLLGFVVSSFRSGGSFDTESKALFGQATYHFSEALSLTLGLRYTEEDKKFLPDQVILANPFSGTGHPQLDAPFMQVGERVLPYVEKEVDVQETTPMINVSYQANASLMIYGTYSEGFKSGGFTQRVFPPIVAGFTAPAGTSDIDLIPTFAPEYVNVFELGFKYETDDSRFRVNGAVFYSDYEDLQIQVFTSVAPVTENAASATLKGFEVEAQWVPEGGWVLEAGVGYVKAQYDDLDEAVTLFSKSNQFERVPQWNMNASLSKEFPLSHGGNIIARVDWTYQDDIFMDSFNTKEIAQEAYSLVNANIAWLSADLQHRVTLGGTNLTDEQYFATGVAGDAFQSLEVIYGRSAEWYLSYSYEF